MVLTGSRFLSKKNIVDFRYRIDLSTWSIKYRDRGSQSREVGQAIRCFIIPLFHCLMSIKNEAMEHHPFHLTLLTVY